MASEWKLTNTITFAESQDMPYLQACIKEGLRLHPATGLPLARIVPKGGVTIANTFIEEGVSRTIRLTTVAARLLTEYRPS